MLEDAVRVGCEDRLSKQRRRALVDRRGAHLHGRRAPDLGADDDSLDAVERKVRDLVRTLAREVDARAGLPRRRAGDRPVHEVEPARARARPRSRGPSRARSRSGPRRAAALRPRAARPIVGRDLRRRLGRRDRENDVRLAYDRFEARHEVEPARSASRCVRALRPASETTTRAPPRTSAAPTALPIAPGLTMPTFARRCSRVEAQPVDDLVHDLAVGSKAMPTRSSSSAGTAATAARFASS